MLRQSESNLASSLEKFELKVKRLLHDPSLESALDANLGSIEVIYDEEFNTETMSLENVNVYKRLICLCLRKFQEIIPGLNGEARDVDLYREQMAGRMDLANRFIKRKYSVKN